MINFIPNLLIILTSVFKFFTPINTPTINPSSGNYQNPLFVNITCETPDVTIYYTTTGNTPIVGTSFTRLYTSPFIILETTTIKAIAISQNLEKSQVSTSVITISNPGICSAPTFSNSSGTYEGVIEITLNTNTNGGQIWYTTNGNTPRIDIPNTFTKLYDSPIEVYETTQIKAITVKNGLVNSPLSISNFIIQNPKIVENPFFNIEPGQYQTPQTIILTTNTIGASIYYTTNGNVPRVNIPNTFTKLYTGPFILNTNTTIRATAIKTGWRQSSISVSTYYFCLN